MHRIPEEFRSRVFIRLFLSYVGIISAFLLLYMGYYMYSYSTHYADTASQEWQRQTVAWATQMDQQLLSAQSLCAAVNTSESCRDALQTAYVERKTVDTMQLYRMLNELKRIKGSSSNMNVYNLLLSFQGESKAYSAGAVVSFTGQSRMLARAPYLGETTVAELLGVQNASNILINKEFFIYADTYTPTSNSSDKGTVMVLFEKNSLRGLTRAALGDTAGSCLLVDGEPLLQTGPSEGLSFTAPSQLHARLSYRVYAPADALKARFRVQDMLPLLVMALLGLAFMVVTYRVSKRYYQPIGSIGKMIENPAGSRDEIEDILDGIRGLIGERNGYREKMVTISPYAQQGMLQSILSGGELPVLVDEQYVSLRAAYFMLALVNISSAKRQEPLKYQDAQELIAHVCREMSGEGVTVVCCRKSVQELYVIVNSDDSKGMENRFYDLYTRVVDALDDARYAVTIGVSRLENDLESLRDACKDAERALEQMLTGGRGCVYFAEPERGLQERSYYFPKDAQKRLVKGLREGDLEGLQAMLDDLYQRNIVESDLPMGEVRAMVDELHLNIRNALRTVYDMRTTHIQIERIREAATIEEIFSYYRTVFETALQTARELDEPAEQTGLESEICQYIDAHFCDPELSLNALADRFGVSTKMVGLICKNAYGKTFLQYVRDRQIQRAAELLQTTDAPLEDIAAQCGFTNLLTFRRNFKAVMNMNPSDFRK